MWLQLRECGPRQRLLLGSQRSDRVGLGGISGVKDKCPN
jgi:hypothetical protein